MPLTIGTKLGPYEIVAPLGAGGMGEVYRARDSKLGREVALKVVPQAFAADAERMARFQREAQVLASLNHPNIAAIYGLEDSGGARALVMELVEGPTLAERIAEKEPLTRSRTAGPPSPSGRGENSQKLRPPSPSGRGAGGEGSRPSPLPLDESLHIARQIAEAFEYAHERGIVHRDLKPANVKVTPEGAVKVLDFGLAKALESERPTGNISNSPTLTAAATQAGIILGTAAYMPPEQAKGKPVDRRADIWAFGCVLYEMLTGKRTFDGETTSDVLAAVIMKEPDWKALAADTPAGIQKLLRRCLAKDAKQRLQAIGEARIAIEETLSGKDSVASVPALERSEGSLPAEAAMGTIRSAQGQASPLEPPLWRRALPWSVAAVAVVVAAFATVAAYRGHSTAGQTGELRLEIVTAGSSDDVTLSPDGRQLVSSGMNDGDPLSLRPLDSEVPKPLPGTESGGATFWSPDSKSIGFVANEKLKRIDVATGAVQTLADAPTERGASWNREGTILFAPGGNGPLYRIPATGGQPVQVTQLRAPQEASHRFPQFLPDGRHFLFWIVGSPDAEGEYVGSLDNQDHQRVCVADGPVTFVPPDHIFLVRESVVYAQRFDLDKLKLTGEPVAVASGVSEDRIIRERVAASDTGIIAFRPDVAVKRQVTWLDRTGRPDGTVGEPLAGVRGGELSPDGRTLAIHTARGEVGRPDELLMDMARGTLTPLTSERSGNARWSPDGKRIAFNGERTGILNIYSMVVGSSSPGEVVLALNEAINLSDWSPDGKYILYSSQSPTTARDVWALPLDGADRKPFPVVQTPAEERGGRFSPDGKWVAYSSNETGREEIFVRPFPGPGPAQRVSTEGGRLPFWRRDGKELYYLREDQLMAVSVNGAAKATLEVGMPQSLFKARGIVVPETDGQRFLALTPLGEVTTPPVTVIVNWAGQEK
ncbi:MAG TPA: protein kinase [Terriglobia bacterium]|nr:protein kinase [Terriglobia bacterium]